MTPSHINEGRVTSRLRDRLRPQTLLRFPEFSKHDDPNWPVFSYTFAPLDSHVWHDAFVDRLRIAIGSGTHLPVYRMADGEFRFLLGRARPVPPIELSPRGVARWLRDRAAGRGQGHRSGAAEYGFESYSETEHAALLSPYLQQVREIAADGVLAIALHDTEGFRFYADDVLDAFDAAGITLTESNYVHMYSIYALLHSSARRMLYRGRRILVATSMGAEQRGRISDALLREGASDVQHLLISPSKALLEKVDLSSVTRGVDVALVGAGVGAANILTQLRPLGAVCLDVGFGLSTLADPSLRYRRPYCVPDEEFDVEQMEFEARAGIHRRATEWLRRRGKK